MVRPKQDAKIIAYWGDGSGRDTYCISDAGGLKGILSVILNRSYKEWMLLCESCGRIENIRENSSDTIKEQFKKCF